MGAALGARPVPRFPHPMGSTCSWVVVSPAASPLLGGWICGAARLPHCPRPALLPCRLKPFTSYKFRVKATNDIGDSEYSEESESLTTLQAGPCPEGPGTVLWLPAWDRCPVPWASPEPHHPLLPRSPRGSPHHPLRHPAHHHIGAHPLAGTVPCAPPGGGVTDLPRGRWHRGVAVPARSLGLSKAADWGCAGTDHPAEAGGQQSRGAPGPSSPSLLFPRSPQPRTRSTGSCWASACATASCCTTACAASPCAASATPAPRGQSSPVSACSPVGRGDTWLGGGMAGGVQGRAASCILRARRRPASCAHAGVLRSTTSAGCQPGAMEAERCPAELSPSPLCHRPLCVTEAVGP